MQGITIAHPANCAQNELKDWLKLTGVNFYRCHSLAKTSVEIIWLTLTLSHNHFFLQQTTLKTSGKVIEKGLKHCGKSIFKSCLLQMSQNVSTCDDIIQAY